MVGTKSGYCVRVERHFYPRTVISVSYHYKNPTKRVDLVKADIISCSRHGIAEKLLTWRCTKIPNSLIHSL
jgi:hypothetical protein